MKKLFEIRDKVVNDTIASIEASIENGIINGQKILRCTTKNEELYNKVINILFEHNYSIIYSTNYRYQEFSSDGSCTEIVFCCIDITIGL